MRKSKQDSVTKQKPEPAPKLDTARKPERFRSPIYSLTNGAVLLLHWLNPVEWFKGLLRFLFRLMEGRLPEVTAPTLDVWAADLFILAKWAILVLWFVQDTYPPWQIGATVYLLVMNAFTYFHYHVWKIMSVSSYLTAERIHRRFVNALLAVAYSMLGFAYLYAGPFRTALGLAGVKAYRLEAVVFSVSNSLTVGYGAVQPTTVWARAICTAQLVNMFFFATIVISASVSTMFGASAERHS